MSRQARAVDALEMPAPVRAALQNIRAEAARARIQLREANAEIARLRPAAEALDELRKVQGEFPEFPQAAQVEIRRVRTEAGRYRVRLRETEEKLAAAQATVASLRLDNSDLLAGIIPQGA